MSSSETPRVWRRAAAAPRVADAVVSVGDDDNEPARCGGKELTVEERYELMKERRRKRKEAEAAAAGGADAKDAARHPSRHAGKDGDEDEDKAAERFRNDRYAVKLLRQDNSAWGGGGAGSGDIG